MGIMLAAGAWPTEARRSGWMCASASSLARTGRAASCEVAARTSYPFGGRDRGPRGSRALGLEADDAAGSWFWRSSSCARKCCSGEGAELVLAERREDGQDQRAQQDKKRPVWMHACLERAKKKIKEKKTNKD